MMIYLLRFSYEFPHAIIILTAIAGIISVLLVPLATGLVSSIYCERRDQVAGVFIGIVATALITFCVISVKNGPISLARIKIDETSIKAQQLPYCTPSQIMTKPVSELSNICTMR